MKRYLVILIGILALVPVFFAQDRAVEDEPSCTLGETKISTPVTLEMVNAFYMLPAARQEQARSLIPKLAPTSVTFKMSSALPLNKVFAVGKNPTKTIIRDARAAQKLLGKHKLSLQWISWDYFGSALVKNSKGVYSIKGEQKGRETGDLVTVDGVIRSISTKDFTFYGTIVTQVSHINAGKPCERKGEMTFRITDKRRYWRLQQIDNPCDAVADYVDIYFR